MLTRVRIEVSDEASAADVSAALDRYENGVTDAEVMRFDLEALVSECVEDQLGREVTDEVIEYDPSLPGYKGRRVVCFKRIDTRSDQLRPKPQATEGSTSSKVTFKEGSIPVY